MTGSQALQLLSEHPLHELKKPFICGSLPLPRWPPPEVLHCRTAIQYSIQGPNRPADVPHSGRLQLLDEGCSVGPVICSADLASLQHPRR